jgi:hypothetical protein
MSPRSSAWRTMKTWPHHAASGSFLAHHTLPAKKSTPHPVGGKQIPALLKLCTVQPPKLRTGETGA